jgi:sugar (glycoside-pentoside-hexuronide) transporter
MTKKLSVREKLGFGVADIGASITYIAINTHLFYFLVNIVDLTPILAGTVFVLGRVFDAFTDPIMGVISDRLKTKIGRKPFIVWGAVPLGISFALLWLVPDASQTVKFILASFLFLLFSLLYTIVQMPYMALIPEIAESYDERTSLSSFRSAFGTFASLLAFAVPPIIVLAVSPNVAAPDQLNQSGAFGWLVMGIIFGVVTALSYLVMAWSTKEPKRVETSSPSGSFISEYVSAFKIYGFPQVFILFTVITIGLIITNSILPFYLESVLKIPGDRQSIVLGSFFIVSILAFPLWNVFAARFGKRTALITGLIIYALSLLLIVQFSPPGGISVFLMIMIVIAGAGASAVFLFPWAMLPDVVEFDQANSGRRREGLVYALFTFGQKIASSIGVFANSIIIQVFNYQQGSLEQTPATITAIKWMNGPVTALVFLVAIFCVLAFPITKAKHEEVRAKLRGTGSGVRGSG